MVNADIVIVGGGIIGSSIAYGIRSEAPSIRVLVIERDLTYARASSTLAMGGIRQQFDSLPNILMSQYGIDFYSRFDDTLAEFGKKLAIDFQQRGYLFLVDGSRASTFDLRYARQRELGVNVVRLTCEQVRRVVQDIYLDDISFALFGPPDGYLNPKTALAGFQTLAQSLGASFRKGNVTSILRDDSGVVGLKIDSDLLVNCPIIVNCAGPQAQFVASLAGVLLPILAVRQQLFQCRLPNSSCSSLPVIVDPGGVHWRYEDPGSFGSPAHIVVAKTNWSEQPGEIFAPDPFRWEDELYPAVVHRMPAYRNATFTRAWAGLYEMTPDHDPILGEHPELRGFYLANGFSGHGIMLAPAIGKTMAALLCNGNWLFNAQEFKYDRFSQGNVTHPSATL